MSSSQIDVNVSDDLKKFVHENERNFELNSVSAEEKELVYLECYKTVVDSAVIVDYHHVAGLRILTRDSGFVTRISSETILASLVQRAYLDACSKPDLSSDWLHTIDQSVATEAIKCMCNVVFTNPSSITTLKSLPCFEGIVGRLLPTVASAITNELRLFDLKLLFITSGLDSTIRAELASLDTFHLLTQMFSTWDKASISESEVNLASEALKVMYNVALSVKQTNKPPPAYDEDAGQLIRTLRNLLTRRFPSDSLQHQLTSHIVNFLNITPSSTYKYLVFEAEQSNVTSSGDVAAPVTSQPHAWGAHAELRAVSVLLDFLHDRLSTFENQQSGSSKVSISEHLGPILTALANACRSDRKIRKYCRLKILPYLGKEVRQLPEEGKTMRNQLCRLLTNHSTEVAEMAAILIYVLCKENIARAVKYSGFGNLSGFLVRHGLMANSSRKNTDRLDGETGSEDESDYTSTDSETAEYEQLREGVNPVTGRWEGPKPNPMEGMSEEHKEYEAMKLVETIDRLHRSGVIQPGTIGEDGRVRPVSHVLELIKDVTIDDKE